MSNSTIAFTTVTGDDAPTTDDVVIEHAAPRNLRVTDPRYGLKTVAKLAHDAKVAKDRRDAFASARCKALTSQREATAARLHSLRTDIRAIMGGLDSGKIKGKARQDAAFEKLERMGKAERKMVDDIARLDAKIGA